MLMFSPRKKRSNMSDCSSAGIPGSIIGYRKDVGRIDMQYTTPENFSVNNFNNLLEYAILRRVESERWVANGILVSCSWG